MNNNAVITAATDAESWDLWEKALVWNNKSLKETLFQECKDYLKWSEEDIEACWGEIGTEKIKERWLEIKPETREEIDRFYNSLDLYIPELASWHALEKNECILQIIKFFKFCVTKGFRNYLDFGAGIGSSGLLFSYYGFSATLADISDVMLSYSQWRFKRHKQKAKFIDLKKDNLPENTYDCTTVIEVLEHVTDPIETMNKIRKSLKIGGYIFATTPFFKDPDRPCHLIHDMNIARKFSKLGLETVSESKDEVYRVLKRIK